ncbi:MAG: hypothetical protein ABI366_02290, partial [Ginsengibacter sp.]
AVVGIGTWAIEMAVISKETNKVKKYFINLFFYYKHIHFINPLFGKNTIALYYSLPHPSDFHKLFIINPWTNQTIIIERTLITNF